MRGSSVQPDQLLTQAHALAKGLWGAHEVLHHTCLIFQPPVTVLFDMSVAHTDICLYVCSMPEGAWQQTLDANACQHTSQRQAGSGDMSKQRVTIDPRQTYSMQASLYVVNAGSCGQHRLPTTACATCSRCSC